MKQFNYIFYSVLFLGFFLPSNSSFHISLAGIEFQVREIAFLLLPVINLLCRSKKQVKVADKKLQILILIFISIVIATEILKHLYFGGGLGAAFKTIRIGLPLFSCLFILFFGIRANIEKVWRTLLWAISASAVLTLLTPFLYLPIYPAIEGENFIEATAGRFINSNASFGIIGVYLLYKDQERWYNQGWLPKITAVLGIIILIATFNRTYLALIALAFIYLSFTEFSLKKAFKYVSVPFIAFGVVVTTYNYSDVIQRQVDKRIFNIVLGQTELLDSVYHDNRDVIYENILDKIEKGYWVIGLPYSQKIFYLNRTDGVYAASKTDISFINILLRYGIIPFTLILIIYFKLLKSGTKSFQFTLLFYTIASLNIDSLLAHNSVFFLFILLFITNYRFFRS